MTTPIESPSPEDQATVVTPLGGDQIRRSRERRGKIRIRRDETGAKPEELTRAKILSRVMKFVEEDEHGRDDQRNMQLQLNAKFRQWTEGRNGPYSDSSDQPMPDMLASALRTHDTLYNATMNSRPPVHVKAVGTDERRDTEDALTEVLDHQFFHENNGEQIIDDSIEQFVNSPVCTMMVSWVREHRKHYDIRTFPAIPPDMIPAEYFTRLVEQEYTGKFRRIVGNDQGWDWEVKDSDNTWAISFYTRTDGTVEMEISSTRLAFDGPRVIVKHWDEVLHPPRAVNLQPPGPSNPNGATHVIIVDHPTIDELRRLSRETPGGGPAFYNLLNQEDFAAIENAASDTSKETEDQRQRDAQAGVDAGLPSHEVKHRPLTRYVCFDTMDVDGDGIEEDVIWWVIKEGGVVAKAAFLTEMYPTRGRPRRPFAEKQYLPVHGQRFGISQLEMVEGLYDLKKTWMDLMIDAGTLSAIPFFFYRPTSSLKQEVMRPWAGEGIPLSNPQQDVMIPTFGNANQAWVLNLMTLADQKEERLTLLSDLQMGRVPGGKSSALRTSQNLQAMLAQGEARPQRVLRRFFTLLMDVFELMHELNVFMLPDGKQFRISRPLRAGEEPYRTVDRKDLSGDVDFVFNANILNTSRMALQLSLEDMIVKLVNPLMIQLGIVTPDNIYRLLEDYAQAVGQESTKTRYITPPTPAAQLDPILAEEVMLLILNNVMPQGFPAPDPKAHMDALAEIQQSDRFGLLLPNQVDLFGLWANQVAAILQQMQRSAAIAEAAGQFQQRVGGGEAGRPPEGPPGGVGGNPPVQGGELIDETLPSAGGGG